MPKILETIVAGWVGVSVTQGKRSPSNLPQCKGAITPQSNSSKPTSDPAGWVSLSVTQQKRSPSKLLQQVEAIFYGVVVLQKGEMIVLRSNKMLLSFLRQRNLRLIL